jgi:hypothetical protein
MQPQNRSATGSFRRSPLRPSGRGRKPSAARALRWRSGSISCRRASRLTKALEDDASGPSIRFSTLDNFLALCNAIEQYEPRALRQIGFPQAQAALWALVLDRVDHELNADRSHDDADGYDNEADAAFGLADSLNQLAELSRLQEIVKPVVSRVISHANLCRETYDQMKVADGPDPEYHGYWRLSDREPEDTLSIFVDR